MCSGHVELDELTDGEVADRIRDLDRDRARIEAEMLAAVAAFDARQIHEADGAASAATWIAMRADLSRPQASSLVKHGRLVRSHPATAEALASLGTTKVRVVLTAVNDRTREAFDRDEAWILAAIAELTVDETRTFMAACSQTVDQEGVDPKPPRHAEVLIRSTFDGWYDLHGRLDPELGARVAAAIRAHAEKLFRSGDDERAEGHRHSQAERQALALGDLIDRAVDPTVTSTRVPPSAVVVINLADLQADDGTGVVVGGGPISSETARRMLCDAEVSRILTDPTGAILEKGRAVRTATMDQRQALMVRDGGCAFPGCDRGPEWCAAHHIIHWAFPACGLTDLSNLLLLCSHHHHLVHEGGFTVRQVGDTYEFARPDGTRLGPPTRWAA